MPIKSQTRDRDMNASAATFDEMERSANRNIAFALWVRNVKNRMLCAVLLAALNQTVRGLVKSLSAERLDALSSVQAVDLIKKLQELHAKLVDVVSFWAIQRLRTQAIFGGSITGLEESLDDLSDVIEDLALSENKEFQRLLSECVEGVKSCHEEGAVVGM